MARHAKTDSDVTSLAASTPPRSPRGRPAYYVLSPAASHPDVHVGASGGVAGTTPAESPLHYHFHHHRHHSSGVGVGGGGTHHSRESSTGRLLFSDQLRSGGDVAAVVSVPWRRLGHGSGAGSVRDDDDDDNGASLMRGGFAESPWRCYALGAFAFVAVFAFFLLVLWGASRSYKPHVVVKHIVLRMSQYGKLRGHEGCVNTVSFNPAGDLLVSGSDDTNIILWDWLSKTKKLVYPSGHHENVFHARVMPFTDDSTIVTVAADGQVRVGRLKEGGEVTTKLVGEHDYRVHKMAIEPGSPYIFYSCGEDGLVQHFDLRSDSATKLFTCYSFLNDRRRVRLNSIAIDPQNPYYFSIGGSDEYVRLYDMRRFQLDDRNINLPVDTFCPKHLIKGGKVHITGIAYSYAREILVSYNDELIYLFQHNMGLGPNPVSVEPEFFDMLDQPQVYSGHRNFRTVKGVSFFGPHDEYVVSGSDCGNVFIWRKKGGELMRIMNGDKSVVNCIEPHPHFPFMATSGIDKTVKLWTPASKKVMSPPKNAKQIIASNERGREVDASRAEVTLSSDVIMHVLRLHRRQSELHMENEPASADLASDDDEAFYIGFGDAESNQRENSDPRECIVT